MARSPRATNVRGRLRMQRGNSLGEEIDGVGERRLPEVTAQGVSRYLRYGLSTILPASVPAVCSVFSSCSL